VREDGIDIGKKKAAASVAHHDAARTQIRGRIGGYRTVMSDFR
jgi:hypothetical protein